MKYALAILLFAVTTALIPVAPAMAACYQSIRTTHGSTATTVTIVHRYCGRSYRAWATFSDGRSIRGAWHTSGQSVAYDSNGGNREGGYQWEPTGGGTIHTHISYG